MEMDKFMVRFVFVVSLAFVLALAVVRSEGNRKFLETLFGNRVSGISHDELDQETVEQMWIHCWKKIDYNSKIIPDFCLNLPYEVEKAISNLHSKAQESLLDCLTGRNILLETPNNDPVSTTWLERLLDFFSEFSRVPRRVLKSSNRPRHRHNPHNANLALRKKHPRQSQTPETDDLALSKKHPHQSHEPKISREKHPHQSHKPETANLAIGKKHPHESHEPKTGDLAPRKKHRNQSHKPKTADLAPRKKHPRQHPEPQTDTFIIRKSPRDSGEKSPNITPSAVSASLALPLKPSVLAPSRTPTSASAPTPTPTPVPAPAPINISPEHSTPSPSPVPNPPSSDPSPPPLVAKQSPLQVAPHTSPPKSEVDTRRYAIIASVAGAVAVLALVALFLVCCLKRGGNKVDLKDGQKDENPLLNVCLSGISGAEKAQVEENHEEKILKTTTFVDNSTSNSDNSSSSWSKSPEATQANGDATPAVPPPPGKKAPPPLSVPPPPPPKKPEAPGPPPPPKGVKAPPAPLGKPRGRSSLGGANDANGGSDNNKAKLKPFFWDKVSPDQSMVWQDLKAGSFQVNEEMMETLFGYTVAEKTKNDERKGSSPYNSPSQYIKIIDPKKAQNLSIMLKALNVTTEEVCDALKEGKELPSELIQNLSKMPPTTEEELKLRLYNDDLSLLGPAERFLKSVVDIPFAFKRMESLLFMSSVQEEVSSINDSFKTLEVACAELKNSRLFLKLLEAVLKTGNRMNDGTYRGDAQAFKLDTLLKLSDVKGTDRKTTLLHFVVQEIIRSEGIRAARTLRESQSMSSVKSEDLNDDSFPDSAQYYRSLGLIVVSSLSSDLENVRKAALIDGAGVTNSVYKLGHSLKKIKDFLENEMKGLEEGSEFWKKLEEFVGHTEDEIKRLVGGEKRINDIVKGTVNYFHGKGAKNEGLRLFVTVADFLVMLDKACKEVRSIEKTPVRAQRREALSPSTSSDSNMSVEPIDIRQRLFPAITANRRDDSSSDDESFSP